MRWEVCNNNMTAFPKYPFTDTLYRTAGFNYSCQGENEAIQWLRRRNRHYSIISRHYNDLAILDKRIKSINSCVSKTITSFSAVITYFDFFFIMLSSFFHFLFFFWYLLRKWTVTQREQKRYDFNKIFFQCYSVRNRNWILNFSNIFPALAK